MVSPLTARLRASLRHYLFERDMVQLMVLTLLVKPVGLVTQMLTAKLFGASSEYDAYVFAVFLVTCLDNLAGQSFIAVVLPLTIKLRSRLSPRGVYGFQNVAALLFIVPVLAYVIWLLIDSGPVIALVGPNLPPETRVWVGRMLPWMVLPGLAYILGTMGKTLLNADRRYGVVGAMPLLVAVVSLVALIGLAPRLGIWALPAGFLIAYLVQLAVVVGHALRVRVLAPVSPAAPRGVLGELWSVGWVFLLSQAVLLVGMSAERFFATGLEEGSLSSLAYVNTIINMGTQLFSMSVSVVAFTRISELVAARDFDGCNAYIADNLNRQSRLVVPASLALCLASPEVVRALLQRGAFDAADAQRTSAVLAMYILALPSLVMTTYVARIFHSMQRMRDRIWLNAQLVLTTIGLSALLIGPLKVAGLGLAAVLATSLHVALSLLVLGAYRAGIRVGLFGRILLRDYLLAALVYGVYRFCGAQAALGGWDARTTFWGAILVAILKAVLVFVLYAAGYLAWQRLARRRSPVKLTVA